MANKSKNIMIIREIIRLDSQGISTRKIALLKGVSKNTVKKYLKLLKRYSLSSTDLLSLKDEELVQIVHDNRRVASNPEQKRLLAQLPEFEKELAKTGVSRYLLWQEYKANNPVGLSYTQFCYYLKEYLDTKDCVMRFEHICGEKLMIDFAGKKLHYIDRETGELIPCEVFVAVLPFSGYTYVEAVRSQKQEDFLSALNNTFLFIGGVPKCVFSDNLKSAVTKADRYEPTFTQLTEQLARHYQTTFMAARVAKPRDKATVESMVNTVYGRVYAPLRNREFFTIKELNEAIRVQLSIHHSTNFQGRDYNRKQLFEKQEREQLSPLPAQRFVVRKTRQAKVQKNYHVQLGEDKHFYSVPYTLVGKELKIVYCSQHVEIYQGHKRVAAHLRNRREYGYTTMKEHMPLSHQYYQKTKGWDKDYFLKKAAQTGQSTLRIFERVLSQKTYVEQTYNSCLGLLRLTEQYGQQRMENACNRALNAGTITNQLIKNILKNNYDKLENESEQTKLFGDHDNIRGPENYQ